MVVSLADQRRTGTRWWSRAHGDMFRSGPQRTCAQLKAVIVYWDRQREVVLDPRIERLLTN
jgi:hypothetical protein